MRRQLRGQIVSPSVRRRGIPLALDVLTLRATAVAPEQRFPSITEFRQALENAAMDIAPGALPYCICPEGGCRALPYRSRRRCATCRALRSGLTPRSR
ncbi:MAG: hypothetical protein AAGC55_13480 [Myxococcota bacterium]